MRYFDTKTRTETDVQSSTTIPMTDERVSWWFESLDDGVEVVYDDSGLPYKTQAGQFINPTVVDGVVVEGTPEEELLYMAKNEKIKEINKAKKVYQNRPVVSKIGTTDYTFFGGLESARKYKDALDLAVSLGLSEGTIKTIEGLVSVTKPDMDKALTAISLQVYKGWLKESYYQDAINAASTVAEINSITWENERTTQ